MRADSGERYHRLRPHYHNNARVTSPTRLARVDTRHVQYPSRYTTQHSTRNKTRRHKETTSRIELDTTSSPCVTIWKNCSIFILKSYIFYIQWKITDVISSFQLPSKLWLTEPFLQDWGDQKGKPSKKSYFRRSTMMMCWNLVCT